MALSRNFNRKEQYKDLDPVQKIYIRELNRRDLKPTDVETSLEEFFQHSFDMKYKEEDICSILEEMVLPGTPMGNLCNATTKMIKNGNGITQFIKNFKLRPHFVEPSAWRILQNDTSITLTQKSSVKEKISHLAKDHQVNKIKKHALSDRTDYPELRVPRSIKLTY